MFSVLRRLAIERPMVGVGIFRFVFDKMQVSMPHSFRVARSQSALNRPGYAGGYLV